jgi:hypothetical protein
MAYLPKYIVSHVRTLLLVLGYRLMLVAVQVMVHREALKAR